MDRQLKQRVVGAGLLVAFGVIFIPIFLDNGGVESPVPPSMNIPPVPTEDVSKRAPALDDDAVAAMEARADEDVELPPPRVQAGAGAVESAAPIEPSSARGEPASASEVVAGGSAAAEVTDGNAAKVEAPVPRMQPVAPRVAPNPDVNNSAPSHPASESHGAVKPTLGAPAPMKPQAKPLPATKAPAKAPSETKPPAPLAAKAIAIPPTVNAWTVQLGSFSSDVNAKKLVDKLRAAGYKAYSEPRMEQGTTVFKVRVGPTPGRAEAARLRQRIEAQFDARGMLVPSH